MYSSSCRSKFVRHIPSGTYVFNCSKSGSAFNKNGHEREGKGPSKSLEQDEQNKCQNSGKNKVQGQNLEQNDLRIRKNGSKPETQLKYGENILNGSDFWQLKGEDNTGRSGVRPGFKENGNGFSNSEENLESVKRGYGSPGLKYNIGSKENVKDKPGFRENSNESQGYMDNTRFEDISSRFQGFKDNLEFQENLNGSQGFKGSPGFNRNINGSQRFDGNPGVPGDSNVSEWFKGNAGIQGNSDGCDGFNDNLGFQENMNDSTGFEEIPNIFHNLEGEGKTCPEEGNQKVNHGNSSGSDRSSSSRVSGKLDYEANLIYEILLQDMPGFDVKEVLQQTGLRMTVPLVRLVLLRIFWSINSSTKSRNAKLGFKFFFWAGQQEGYEHNSETYNLLMKIFAICEELKAMWRLVDEMMVSGCPITARSFSILLCSCGEAGMPRQVLEKFLRSKKFSYRPYKHSYNAILHVLLKEHYFKLVEWVYQEMLNDGHLPDILTYNIIIYAKYKLGKLNQFHVLLEEMGQKGFAPDLHTYNILLHVLGQGDKPLAALKLLNYMTEVRCPPQNIHFTALIDGLSRGGNLDACKYFFEDMGKKGCEPDVVCYTVMITTYIVAGQLENAETLFDEMIQKGQLPNVFTYNAMIQGLCGARRYEEACCMLDIMESRGCNPNFMVYNTLVKKLRQAEKFTEAQVIVEQIEKKGHYAHLIPKLMRYRR
jgi:pentatricopeptide repeat protein